jgi:hypothetical protein
MPASYSVTHYARLQITNYSGLQTLREYIKHRARGTLNVGWYVGVVTEMRHEILNCQ